jgi:hypothetical protein
LCEIFNWVTKGVHSIKKPPMIKISAIILAIFANNLDHSQLSKALIKILVLLIFSFGLLSCVALNSHQTGKTVGRENYSITGNFNFGNFDSEQYFTLEDSGTFYIAEIGGLYGIRENFDVGLKVNSSFHFTGVSKFQFLGDKESIFVSSIGFDIGAGPLGLMMGVMSYSSSFSLYNSIHPTDNFALTLSPRYTYLGFTNFIKEYGFTRRNNIYGYSLGLIIGKKHQFSIELSQYVNNEVFSFDTQPIISLGYIWNIKNQQQKHAAERL